MGLTLDQALKQDKADNGDQYKLSEVWFPYIKTSLERFLTEMRADLDGLHNISDLYEFVLQQKKIYVLFRSVLRPNIHLQVIYDYLELFKAGSIKQIAVFANDEHAFSTSYQSVLRREAKKLVKLKIIGTKILANTRPLPTTLYIAKFAKLADIMTAEREYEPYTTKVIIEQKAEVEFKSKIKASVGLKKFWEQKKKKEQLKETEKRKVQRPRFFCQQCQIYYEHELAQRYDLHCRSCDTVLIQK